MRLAILLPSRGLVFSETIEEIIREAKDWGGDWEIYWAHQRPIPECFNEPTEKALADKRNTHFWIVEEDMGLPKGVLKDLMSHNVESVACDYPVTTDPSGTILRDPYGKAYFTGCGCLLVTREVLEFIPKPIWRSDLAWSLTYHFDYIDAEITKRPSKAMKKIYGHQDINFGLYLYAKGRPIEICDHKVCFQRKIVNLGMKNSNLHGVHKIRKANKRIKTYAFPIEFKEVDAMGFVELWEWDEGEKERFFTDEKMAKRLIKEGRAFKFKPGELIVNNDLDEIWATPPTLHS